MPVLWVFFIVFLLIDLGVSVVRSSLLNTRLPLLLNRHEQRGSAVSLAVAVIDRPRLRVSLRLAMILNHVILSGIGLLLVQSVSPVLSVGWALAILLAAMVVLILFEFVLEGWVLHDPESAALYLALPGRLIDLLMTPFSMLAVAAWGRQHSLQKTTNPMTDDDLRSWVEDDQPQGSLEKGERKMIFSIIQFSDTLAREIMVPRIDIMALDANTSLPDAVAAMVAGAHSRIPVFEETIDHIVGLIYSKDLLRVMNDPTAVQSLRQLLRPAYFIPEAKKVDDLLTEMQAQRVHMAIVVDEYGGVAGLVTMEDIVEEIVGEIRDEYDQFEELPYQAIKPGEYLFQGRVGLDDFNELMDTHLPKEAADTLGGFIYSQMGRVPAGGESIETDGVLLTVEQVIGRRIRKVRAQKIIASQEMEVKNDHDDG